MEPFKVHVPPIKVQTPKFRVGVLGVKFTVAPKHTGTGEVGNTTMPPVGITVIVSHYSSTSNLGTNGELM